MEWALRPGTILLEKYRVESLLGRGGMGVVLKVTHLHLGEELALKILSPGAAATPDVTARFLREAQSAVRLRGEHVAKVFDVGVLPDRVPYMVMEYLRGVDLAGELGRRRMLMPGEAVDYVLQACEALAEAHANEIVHRDIKAANLFLTTRPDGTPLVKVLDFGISKVPFSTSGVMTKTDVVMGTPGYMSPEQMKAPQQIQAAGQRVQRAGGEHGPGGQVHRQGAGSRPDQAARRSGQRERDPDRRHAAQDQRL